jgi:L-lactate dehydrogenase complex protein LldG
MERVRRQRTNAEGAQTMTARDQMLTRVRGALGRTAKASVPEPPPVRLHLPRAVDRVAQFTAALEALAGKATVVPNLAAAKIAIDAIVAGRSFVDHYQREACATAEFGINRADYALADTGSLVFLSESGESRLISLLPPRHIAIVAREKILSGLDELFTVVPHPAAKSSSMVLVTGPSRTADIEMRLVRGVHGPGEIHVMIVEDVTPSQSNASEET